MIPTQRAWRLANGHHREHPLHPPAHQEQRELGAGDVGDHQVEEALARLQAAACAEIVGGAKSLSWVIRLAPIACLEALRSPIDSVTKLEPLDGVLDADGKPGHHPRDPVAQSTALILGADADRDQRAQLETLVACPRARR